MVRRNNPSPDQRMLRRSRLHSLIDDGLEHPLMVMLAGPGYGKTQAMAGYLAETGLEALWLRLTGLDNLTTRFWEHLIQALRPVCPDLAGRLHSLGFPDTLSSFDAFIQLLVGHFPQSRRLVWVFDDFGVITNEQIKTFFRMAVDLELTQFPLVLISSELTSTESIAFLSSKRSLILTRDLRFTLSEIDELYRLYGLSPEPDELSLIERQTEGWALALHLLVQRRDRSSGPRILDELAITHIFEERFFSAYSRKQRLMLVQLSLLNYFTRELAIELYEGRPVELEELGNHPFFSREPGTGRLFWHNLYHLFLRNKQYLLTWEDKRRAWNTAARHYVASGDVLEAIACCGKSGDHVNMLGAMGLFARKLRSITEKDAEFLLERLDLLTPEEVDEYPVAGYYRAHIYMNILELAKSERLLADLEKKLLARARPEETALLGDVYVSLGFIHMMRNQLDYDQLFQKADACLPDGSSFYDRRTLAMENNYCFALSDNSPGARERVEEAAFRAAPWINKVLGGCMSGMEYIISAESALMVGDFDQARQQAYRGIYKAEAADQHDYVFNGYFVLARAGFISGDLEEMTKPVRDGVEYAGRYKIAVLEEIRDTLLTWYHLKLRDFGRIPRSIITMDYSRRPLPARGRTQITCAGYLAVTGEYARLVGMLENARGLFLADGIWHDRICLFILLAIGHHHLGNTEAALKSLWTAYDMCHHNQVITPFIEAGDYLTPLLGQARERPEFSPEWLDSIYELNQGFVKRAEAVRAEYLRRNPATAVPDNPLSRREREVLQALSQGLTREEIALRQYISVNTVKSVIRSIYTKLNANNRAEAVSIALAHDYIEGYVTQ